MPDGGVDSPVQPARNRITPMSDPTPDQPAAAAATSGIFRRLLRMLRPWRGTIILSVGMLIAGGICELFPAFIWKYVADDVATQRPSSPTISWMASLAGRIHN